MKKKSKRITAWIMLVALLFGCIPSIQVEAAVTIPEDAVQWDDHYYRLYDAGISWEDARIACIQLGGHLVTITSAEEQAVVLSLLSSGGMNMYWLGSRLNQDWAWVTGEDFTYSNWGPEEPNNMDGEEAYVQIYAKAFRKKVAGDWNDASNVGADYSADFYKLEYTGYICEWDMLDSDGDGLYDRWETEGIDTDGDGEPDLMINEMGADPYVPDVFVEVDWMVRPEKKFLFWKLQSARSMKASENALRMVYEAFRAQGINLHIDAGPASTDFVTGRAWGDLSGANEIEYVPSFDTSTWGSVISTHFTAGREVAFKHCICVDTYDGSTSSGIANGIPGQYFILANQDWVYEGGDISVAGTFMHELGHTLGLMHGGCDHVHYKPNYLSVMNYLFQTTGLVSDGENILSYSEYRLPDLDEAMLDENDGIDPEGMLGDSGLGTSWYCGSLQDTIRPAAGNSIDFDRDGIIEEQVAVDLNDDGQWTMLLGSSPDRDRIVFSGGRIGDMTALGKSVKIDETVTPDEKDLEDALTSQSLGNIGDGYVEIINTTLRAGIGEQVLYFDVSNRGSKDMTFMLSFVAPELPLRFKDSLTVSGVGDQIGIERIAIPVPDRLKDGEYVVECTLTPEEGQEREFSFIVSVVDPSNEELDQLRQAIEDGALAEFTTDEQVIEQITIVANSELLPAERPEDATEPEEGPQPDAEETDTSENEEVSEVCTCICHSDNFFMKICHAVLKFFWRIFGVNAVCDCGEAHY